MSQVYNLLNECKQIAKDNEDEFVLILGEEAITFCPEEDMENSNGGWYHSSWGC